MTESKLLHPKNVRCPADRTASEANAVRVADEKHYAGSAVSDGTLTDSNLAEENPPVATDDKRGKSPCPHVSGRGQALECPNANADEPFISRSYGIYTLEMP